MGWGTQLFSLAYAMLYRQKSMESKAHTRRSHRLSQLKPYLKGMRAGLDWTADKAFPPPLSASGKTRDVTESIYIICLVILILFVTKYY